MPDHGDRRGARRPLGMAWSFFSTAVEPRPDGSKDEVAPASLADLGDSDNNHLLCLDTATPATAVAFAAGHLVDPNGDLNPDSQIAVTCARC